MPNGENSCWIDIHAPGFDKFLACISPKKTHHGIQIRYLNLSNIVVGRFCRQLSLWFRDSRGENLVYLPGLKLCAPRCTSNPWDFRFGEIDVVFLTFLVLFKIVRGTSLPGGICLRGELQGFLTGLAQQLLKEEQK